MSIKSPSKSAPNKFGAKILEELGRKQLLDAGLCVAAKCLGPSKAMLPLLETFEYSCMDSAGRPVTFVLAPGHIEGNMNSPLVVAFRVVNGEFITECVLRKISPLWDFKPSSWKDGVEAAAKIFSKDFAHAVEPIVLDCSYWVDVRAKDTFSGDLDGLRWVFFAYLHASLGNSMLAGTVFVNITQAGQYPVAGMYPPFDKNEVIDAGPASDRPKTIH